MTEYKHPTNLSLTYGPYTISSCYLENNVPDKPPEDAIPRAEIVRGYLAIGVADGVTRTRYADGRYPYPSRARMAADIALSDGMQYARDGLRRSEPSESILFASGVSSNNGVGALNRRLGLTDGIINYGEIDFAGTTLTIAALTQIGSDYQLTWGHIGDSRLQVVSPEGNISTLTFAQTAYKDLLEQQLSDELGDDFNLRDWEVLYRGSYRNQPHATAWFGGEEIAVGFGVLTGQPGAIHFIDTGTRYIQPGHSILLFTDGAVGLGYPRIGEIVRTYPPAEVLPTIFREAAEIQESRGLPRDDMSGISGIFTG